MIYGDWLIPPIVHQYRAIAVDFPCDCGKSRPPNGDPGKCPQTEDELALWAYQVIATLHENNQQKVAVLGYSYGAFVAVVVAEKYPDMIDKVLAIAPAAVFAPVERGWILRALAYALTGRTMAALNWFLRSMSTDPNFNVVTSQTPQNFEMTNATRILGATVLAVNPDQFAVERLQAIHDKTKVAVLLIGQNETVTNSTRAIEHASNSGWETRVYPNAGHLMLMEEPTRTNLAQDVANILLANVATTTPSDENEFKQEQEHADKEHGESATAAVNEGEDKQEGADTGTKSSEEHIGGSTEEVTAEAS